MRCPFCSHVESKVADSRSLQDQNSVKRRRECLKCQNRFTTFETVDLTIQVKKRDGTYEDFNPDKLLKGLDMACCHSKVSHDQVRALVSKITAQLLAKQVREISTKDLGDIVITYLKKMDMVAYIRFACVYRRFKDIDEVVNEIKSISPKV
jgi:transcriptional repressor NrdR